MSECTRFEDEGLSRLVRDEPLDGHFEQCEQCLASYEKYKKITASLGQIDNDAMPPENWQDKVLAEIDQSIEVPGRPRGMLWAGSLAAGVLAVALLLNVTRLSDTTLELNMTVERGDVVYRGGAVNIGDVLHIDAQLPDTPYSQLRLYRGSQRVLFSCTEEPPCTKSKSGISAEFTLVSIGSYRSVIVTSDNPLPTASDNLDEDVRVAREQGANVVMSRVLDVH